VYPRGGLVTADAKFSDPKSVVKGNYFISVADSEKWQP
jgi:hypothetical protein